MGLLYLRGNTIQEVGVEMTMSCSIRWVAVIDGSLYSRFYGMDTSNGLVYKHTKTEKTGSGQF